MTTEHPRWRTPDGRFAPTYYPRFRRKDYRNDLEYVPIDVWRALLAEAEERVTVVINGRRRLRVTRLEARYLELSCGVTPRTARLRTFFRAVKFAAHYVDLADAIARHDELDSQEADEMLEADAAGDEDLWRYLLRRRAARAFFDTPADSTLQLALRTFEDGVPGGDRT